MRPDYWKEGLHLFGGIGVNGSIYNSQDERQNQGFGVNFKTDLVYMTNHSYALELGSQVKFNRVQEYFIWDTQFTVGLRRRIRNYYGKVFYGRAPTVFFLDDAPRFYERKKASRVQFDGPVYGVAIGKMYETKGGSIWFIEGNFIYQKLGEGRGVKQDGDVSEVVFRDSSSIRIYGAQVNIGLMIF